MKRIGDIVFFGCSSLGEVEYNAIEVEDQSKRIFPESIWSITFGDKVRVIPAYLLDGCYGLDAINLPESLEVIGEHAFSGCGGIKELVIPDKVEKIGGLAIYQMENLETLTIGEGLKDLNNASFCTGCTKLTHITWNAIKLNDVPVRCMAPVETAIFGDKVEFVPGHLFWGDGALKDVTIGKSVKKIGEATFRECSITKIDLPETLEEVGDYAFYRSCIENIFIPENVVSFGYSKYMRPMIVADKEEFYYDGTTPEVTFTSNIPGYELASLSEITLDGSAGKHSIPATASFVGEKNFTIDLAYIYTVNKRRQEIIWEQAFEGLGVGDEIVIDASATSGLDVSVTQNFASRNYLELKEVDGKIVMICKNKGDVELTATQPGDDNWEAAQKVVKKFTIGDKPTGVKGIEAEGAKSADGIYDVQGRKLIKSQKGINIIRYSDGSVRKLSVK